MNDDLEYVNSLEKELDELESEKADFSNIYDLLLEECVSKDVTCSYLHSLSDLNAYAELQCLYLHKVKECECLAQKLSKQTESVNKEVHNKLLKSFAKLEKHSISLELSLQHCKEQMKTNSVCKENASNVFRKEREQYHEIQDLKAQMQDKNMAINELKKLILITKGKSVKTHFDRPSVVRQPNAQRIPKPSNLPQNRNQAVQNTNVLKPGMYRIATTTTQNREPQLPHASRNTNPNVSKSSGLNHTTSVSRPQLKCYQVKDKVVPNNSQVKFKKKEVEDHHRISSISKKTKSVTACNDSSNSRTSNVNVVCAECGKCVFNSNHDACVSRYLKDVNARTKKHKVVPISASKPKRKENKSVATPHKKTVASDTTIQKSKSYHKELYENTNQEWKWWIAKRCPSGYKWTQKPLRTKKIWMPKIRKEDVSTSISPTIDIVSRITNIIQLILFIVDPGCTKHMTSNLKLLCNFVEKFLGTVHFGNDQFAPILGYGDLIQGNVAFRKSTCFVRDLQGNNLLTGIRGSDLYTISLQETTSSTPICFMASAENNTSGPASDYDNSGPVPPRQNVVPTAEKTDSLQQRLEFLFSPLLEEYYNPAHGHDEDNNNDQAPNASPVPQGQKASDYDNSDHMPPRQNVVSYSKEETEFRTSREEVYVAQPEGFVDPDHPEKVYLLRKALYELKQAPRAWYDELSNFLMSKGFSKDQSYYHSKIGSLMYLTSSRPDLVQAVCYCARYQARPTQKHLKEVKRIFKYLKGTINMGLWYPKDSGFDLTAFSDADHAGCIDTQKSTSRGIQFLGDKLVSWMSKKQNCIAMSSAEVQYVALSASCAEVMWMRSQLQDYGFNYNKIPLYCDFQSAIAISCNPVQHSRTKHIHTRTKYQLADMFMKTLPEDRFKYLLRRIRMRCLTPADLEVLTNETA
ncbi:retrovirus-related pol polyprotein from transposon TNT 1-94 [Tanacetum coccineum]